MVLSSEVLLPRSEAGQVPLLTNDSGERLLPLFSELATLARWAKPGTPFGAMPGSDALAMALAFREHTHAFSNISIYCQRLARQFERTLDQLRKIQDERHTRERFQLHDAAKLLKMHQEDGLPYNPAEDGFVFSNDDIETYINRNQRLDHAVQRAHTT